MSNPNESTLEDVTLDWFQRLGYAEAHGPDLAPGEKRAVRSSYGDVVVFVNGLPLAVSVDFKREADNCGDRLYPSLPVLYSLVVRPGTSSRPRPGP